MNAEDIASEIHDKFFKTSEVKESKIEIGKILKVYFEHQKVEATADHVIDFLERIWARFSIGDYVDVFVDFARAEKALYGFAENYRDHLMHLFNVHVMGLTIFSKLIAQNENKTFELLKIKQESDVVPFPNHYDKYRRLYYIWCLSSTFHDIAIPIDYRKRLVKGLGKYLKYFKIETDDFYLEFPFMSTLDINRYSTIMSELFASKIEISNNPIEPTYNVDNYSKSLYLYFRSVLSCAMNEYDHGVLGSYFLFRSIEELFLCGKNSNPKYDLDLCALETAGHRVDLPRDKKEWDKLLTEKFGEKEAITNARRTYDFARGETEKYNDYVLKQDVARAALAIALHNLKPNKNPKIFPLKFSDFPISVMLILLDELQEFQRPEEVSLTEVVRCREFPILDVRTRIFDNMFRIQLEINLDLKRPRGKNKEKILKKYNEMLEESFTTYDELVRHTWNHTFETISNKISFEKNEPLELWVKVTVGSKNPDGKELVFKSKNWTD